MEAQINLDKNMIYVVSKQGLRQFKPPKSGFGETVISWQNNAPVKVITTFSEKLDQEGERL